MKKFTKFILDLLFPVECLGCGKSDIWLCLDCLRKIKVCPDCPPLTFGLNDSLTAVWVAADYQDALIARAIQCFKYEFVREVGVCLSELLISHLEHKRDNNKSINFDIVVPVPLAKKRLLWRGFNQAEVLSQDLCRRFGWPQGGGLLYRRYHTRPQVGLDLRDRADNVRGIFAVKGREMLEKKRILLVDDVITTGATMRECAKVLREAGASEVWGIVLAKG